MNLAINSTRDLLAFLIISGSVVAGAWLALVEPARTRVAALEAERARLLVEVTRGSQIGGDIERWTSRLRDATEQLRQLKAVAAVAASDRAAIERLTELADRSGIVIDEMRPQEILSEAPPAARIPLAGHGTAPTPAPEKSAPTDLRRSFRIILTGGYGALAEFFRQLDNAEQLAVIRTVRIVSSGLPGSKSISAEVTLDLLAPAVVLSNAAQPRTHGGAQ